VEVALLVETGLSLSDNASGEPTGSLELWTCKAVAPCRLGLKESLEKVFVFCMPITGERGHPILTGEEELAIFTQGET
jgi:hypothetical protein